MLPRKFSISFIQHLLYRHPQALRTRYSLGDCMVLDTIEKGLTALGVRIL
ncbi:hypothetical protein [Candidatus Venteria ishoeyi]|nr:hypothetical protein [Candidatus Venteria ishoeyi]MDM8544853.1 hypothetical protein [Candidatus Venteria ishoeyi]